MLFHSIEDEAAVICVRIGSTEAYILLAVYVFVVMYSDVFNGLFV